MYAFIKGELVHASPSTIVVQTGGIGFQILIPANVFAKLPQTGTSVLLHTSFIVRELSHTLYGFLAIHDRELFEILMGVSGIGPKIALSIIGHLSINELQRAINNADIPVISRVPGIGKKTAERMIIELRDKLQDICPPDPSELSIQISDPNAQKIRDAMNALINLGYNQMTAQKAIKKTIQDMSQDVELALLITTSLKNVKKKRCCVLPLIKNNKTGTGTKAQQYSRGAGCCCCFGEAFGNCYPKAFIREIDVDKSR